MLQLDRICKSYTTGDFTQQALADVSIAFRNNEFVAILGPSGSGKTTLLNIIGGLDQYDSGDLIIEGVSTKDYSDRDWDTYRNNRVGFVFQSYNLIPHQTVLANVELALTLSGVSGEERKNRALEALEAVGLGQHVNKKPAQLSGGQMQRVAIARALVNDPDIVLADEPTGALDSTTSVQIMDLLTEIAKDRLVIMVTHNPELADRYATRTVRLADGVVRSDTDPFDPTAEEVENSHFSPIRRTRMGFLTALSLSFNNLMTKKGRTIMTAFAGSIGIIGIAAILALANGVNSYIKTVEEETLSVYPLQIFDTGFDLTSMLGDNMGGDDNESSADGGSGDSSSENSSSASNQLHESKMVTSMFDGVQSNDLSSLKAYLESPESHIEEYAKSIDYSYDVAPYIFDADTEDGVRQINPNVAFNAMGMGSDSSIPGIKMGMMSTDVFEELMSDLSMLEGQYDVVAGHWPEKYNECMMVVGRSGKIPDVVLYALGLRDPDELDAMVHSFVNNEEVNAPTDEIDVTYEQIMDVKMNLVSSADFYQYDETYGVWVDKSGDEAYMKKLVDKGEPIKISGIAMANPDSNVFALGGGLFYTPELVAHIIELSGETQIVKDQLAEPTVDVFNGKTFAEEAEDRDSSDFDMGNLFTIDAGALQAAFTMDPSALNIDMASLNVNFDSSSLPQPAPFDPGDISGGAMPPMEPNMTEVSNMMTAMMAGYGGWTQAGNSGTFQDYLQSPAAGAIFAEYMPKIFDMSAMQQAQAQAMAKMQAAMQQYMQTYMQQLMGALQQQMQQIMGTAMTQAMTQLSQNMANAMAIDEDAFMNAFQFNMDSDELSELMMSMMSSTVASFDNNLSRLDYAELDNPSQIDIYAKDFDAKQGVIDILENYNQRMVEEGEDSKEITYTDLVGTMMSSVTTIIDMISYVLIAFVSISLIVSSIMIGVITYISVLERKKEIGILRAIGASKGDVSRVFNAETTIEGLVSGLLGVGITAILCVPASAIVYALFDVPNVAQLPLTAGIILVVISVFLTFIAGLIPARSAARKDPVEALRSE